jgi:hypothetical protein
VQVLLVLGPHRAKDGGVSPFFREFMLVATVNPYP